MEYFTLNRETGEVKFPILSPNDFAVLTAQLRGFRKGQKAINLQLAGVHGDAATKELDKIDARPVRFGDVIEWVNTPEGQVAFILRSLQKENPDAKLEDVDRSLPNRGDMQKLADEMLRVAAGVAGLTLTEKRADPLAENANPPTGIGDMKAA